MEIIYALTFLPKEEKKEKENKAAKVGRRLSARVGDLFRSKPKTELSTPAKVDEHPPVIDEPAPVAPLENPASSEAAPAAAPAAEEPVPAEPALAATPVISAVA